jgi:membrane protease YdiL (CAAX protease family)
VFADAATGKSLDTLDVIAILAGWVVLVVVAGAAVLALRRLAKPESGVFPAQRHRAVPWGFLHVAVVLLICLVWFSALGEVFQEPWANLLARPFIVVTVFLFLRRSADARVYQFGLSGRQPLRDVTAGYLFFALLTPAVFGVHWTLLGLIGPVELPEEQKRLEQMLMQGPAQPEWWFLVLGVVLLAPVMEELVFRGVLQPWMAENVGAADLLILVALVGAIIEGASLDSKWPLLFLVTVGTGYVTFEYLMRRWLPRPGVARAIYATSLVFAALHPWPDKVAIFFLSLGLGYVAYRSQSLIGPTVLHVLFNATSVLAPLARPFLKEAVP